MKKYQKALAAKNDAKVEGLEPLKPKYTLGEVLEDIGQQIDRQIEEFQIDRKMYRLTNKERDGQICQKTY